MKRFQHVGWYLGIFATLVCLIGAGCAGPKPKPGEAFACAADSKIEKTIAAEAELADFSCVVKNWEGVEVLHFNVAVKNISTQPQRYRVHIFMDNGKAVGGLIPQSTTKGLVEPGQTASFVYPVSGMDRAPKSIELMVKTMSQ